MSTATATFENYVQTLAKSSPDAALQIAISETERQKAIAASAAAEYRALAEIEFDTQGRIVKATMGGLWRLAQMYAGSEMVPEHYRRKPNDCFIACQMSMRMRVDPFAYMQNSYIVHGRPGVESKLPTAVLNTSGKIIGRVRYREVRDDKGKVVSCTAYATDAATEEVVESTVDWALVTAEGWNKPKGSQVSKWMTMPEQMFKYRSAIFLIRAYFPEVLMGMKTVDELVDTETPEPARPTENSLQAMTEMLEKSTFEETPIVKQEEPTTGKGQADAGMKATDDWEKYVADLAAYQDATKVYDKWFGPDSTVEFTAEQNDEACKLRDARIADIKATRGEASNKKQGDLIK